MVVLYICFSAILCLSNKFVSCYYVQTTKHIDIVLLYIYQYPNNSSDRCREQNVFSSLHKNTAFFVFIKGKDNNSSNLIIAEYTYIKIIYFWLLSMKWHPFHIIRSIFFCYKSKIIMHILLIFYCYQPFLYYIHTKQFPWEVKR